MRKADEFLLIIFIIGMVYFILPVPVVSGYPPHSRDECTPNIACFVQGDYLKYYVTVKGEPYQYLNYTHEGLGEENTILVGDWVHSVSEFPISTYDGS
ncbi:MAG TPA: hypothetical protein VLC72_03340, partial [Nitrosopumilaceae archaeon]|nr:hypothetical protein [Nitrosopumilaceae archaeon]